MIRSSSNIYGKYSTSCNRRTGIAVDLLVVSCSRGIEPGERCGCGGRGALTIII